MDRLPPGAEDPFYALQPQQPTRAQHPPPNQILPQQPTRVQHPPPTQIQPQQPTRAQHPPPTQIQPQQPTRVQHPPPPQIQTVPSYRPSLPSGSEMPDEWGYPPPSAPQFPNIPRNVQGAVIHPTGSVPRGAPQSHPTAAAAPTVPTCRIPNCHRPVGRDEKTHELTEFCSLEHMCDAARSGFPLCPACERCPRRSDNKFCGSRCEEWAVQKHRQQQQQQQQQQQLQSQELRQRQQQEHHQRHQHPQHWQSSTMVPPSTAPSHSAGITWSDATRGSPSANNGNQDNWQGRYPQ
ncbi:hypothetical protein DFH94DRAFT_303404 [Russula ochroleuca]|uniref:Uncharacterized protein n=1 Tax=Russula ochroleuca TaxID=152965 RepID=A0A9P5TBN5_9AGAM|nr:hypothetical protein DFH94DRAFT_303404 [Russula ochroleuca]